MNKYRQTSEILTHISIGCNHNQLQVRKNKSKWHLKNRDFELADKNRTRGTKNRKV